jgi:glucosamine--fructose-6-phosphate aminotransferase (isomerizing)
LAERSSRFLEDVLREPRELRAILRRLLDRGAAPRAGLEAAATSFASAPVRWIAGMGSSWHAGFAIQSFCDEAALPVRNLDAGEIVHFGRIPPGTAILALSRSGRSVEVVDLLPKARAAGATVLAVTNDPESPLARGADRSLALGASFDFNVSVTMYSGVALAGALVAAMAARTWRDEEAEAIDAQLEDAERSLPAWRASLEVCPLVDARVAADAPVVLLARGPGLAAAHEARQLFEEAAKLPATAHSTGAFRHGPNEMVHPGVRVVLWLAAEGRTRALDLALAADLRRAGAHVTVVGRDVPRGAAELRLELPRCPARWQFLVELMPVRLLIERIARLRGVDCDTFRYCPFVVSEEGGLGDGHGTAGGTAPPATAS